MRYKSGDIVKYDGDTISVYGLGINGGRVTISNGDICKVIKKVTKYGYRIIPIQYTNNMDCTMIVTRSALKLIKNSEMAYILYG